MRFKIDGRDIIFIHIPRTAGTYIENSISSKYNISKHWPKADTNILYGLLKLNDNQFLTLQHLTINEMVKFNFIDNKNSEFFTIVRNPYDRVLSLYNNWFNVYDTLDKFLDKLISMKLDEYAFNGIITNKKNFNYLNMTDNIDDIKYFVLPQYYYIKQDSSEYGIDIIKFEDMEKLNNKYNINVNYQRKENNYKFTEGQKIKICEIYKKDFELFDFDKNP